MFSLIQIALKIIFLILLYLFLFSLIRRIGSDLDEGQPLGTKMAEGPAKEPRLVVLDSQFLEAGRMFEISGELSIGRDDSSDVRIMDDFVSKEHALIYGQDDAFYLDDLESANGTFLNGERLWGARPLKVGDKIQLGRTLFEFLE
ncbi:MAG: FHA domain-containing protein [Actinomycetota bacterium]|nr:FHA domain-containing protein [Actinomycetota bacterium]